MTCFYCFQKVLELDWKQPVRVLVHVADAPAHGNTFHPPSMMDTMPQEDKDGKIMKGYLEKLKSMEIAYFFGKITPHTDMARCIFLSLPSAEPRKLLDADNSNN